MKLHLEHIPLGVTNDQLRAALAVYGAVDAAELTLDADGGPTGHGIADMADEKEATFAQRSLNGVAWGRPSLSVRSWDGRGCNKCRSL
jgi:hypothetical protein